MILVIWPLWPSVGVLVAGALAITWLGTGLARAAETLAIRTGLGQAVTGALFLGASTSLPGIITSVVAAADDQPRIAVSNALGGIAAQTLFLAIADITHKRVNLEHASASPTNIFQGALLVGLITLVLLTESGPAWTVWSVHPMSVVLIVSYLWGLRIAHEIKSSPPWEPQETPGTQEEQDEEDDEDGDARSDRALWLQFALLALATAVAGWAVARAGISIAEATPISDAIVGGVFTAIATSLPELVTAIAAVRRGALILAVGDIIGGNAFDVLFAAVADFFYRAGSIYHAIGANERIISLMGVLMAGIVVMGLVRRERKGPGNIGLESVLLIVVYVVGFALVAFMSGGNGG